MLTSIDGKFIFGSARLGLFSSANQNNSTSSLGLRG